MMLYKFTEITLFSRVTDSVSDLEKFSINPTLHAWFEKLFWNEQRLL